MSGFIYWQLERAQEAEDDLEFLLENIDDSISLAVQGLLCHGRETDAAELLLKWLRDSEKVDAAVSSFETGPLELFYTPSILPQPNDLLSKYPELAAELAKHVRDMPEAYIPRASLKRTKIELPDWD